MMIEKRNMLFASDSGGSEGEIMNFEQMVSALEQWEGHYDEYIKAFDEIDGLVLENINASSISCIYGTMGTKIYDAWTNKVLPFRNVYYKLRELSSKVTEAYKDNVEFQEVVNEHHGNIKTVDTDITDRDSAATQEEREAKRKVAELKGGVVSPGDIQTDGNKKYVEIGGEKYYVDTDANGKITSVTGPDGKKYNPNPVPEDYTKSAASIANPPSSSLTTDNSSKTVPQISYSSEYTPEAAENLYANVVNTQAEVDSSLSEIDAALIALGYDPNYCTYYVESDDPSSDIVGYLYEQRNIYQQASYELDSGTASGFWEWDGAFTNALSSSSAGHNVDGVEIPNNAAFGGDSDAYQGAVNEANNINSMLSSAQSVSDINQTLADAGYPTLAEIASSTGE